MIEYNLKNKVAVITGAAGNLGGATAELFLRAGAQLALIDINFERLRHPHWKQAEDIGLFETDLTDADSINDSIYRVVQRFKRIDVLVNVAGGFKMGTPVHKTPIEDWDIMLNMNAKSVFLTCRAVIPHMLKKGTGRIVNVAARAALEGKAKMAPYCVSKAAVITLTQSLAAEYKMDNINVNCILPGTIDTPQNRADMPKADFGSWVPPTDLADEILHLCSPRANSVTSAAVAVYGKS